MRQHGLLGVPRDPAAAVACYERAATLGDADALFQLAVCHLTGKGVPQRDTSRAIALFCQAADQGSAAAQYALAVLPKSLV